MGNINQEIGESITYFRRYSLFTILNCIGDKDNDGVSQGRTYNKAPEKTYNTQEEIKARLNELVKLVSKRRWVYKNKQSELENPEGFRKSIVKAETEYIQLSNKLPQDLQKPIHEAIEYYNKNFKK